MIALNSISFEFGGTYLYKDINWHIKPKERIGLVGSNGSGKTTILKMINGQFEVREGSLSMMKSLKLGYLHQEMAETYTEETILEVAMKAFEECKSIEAEMEQLYKQMEHDTSEALIDRVGHLQQEFERLHGYTIQSDSEEILEGLGFKTEDLNRPMKEFSGGWRMRAILARMLLEQPDLLMLDEPTNHLDLPSIEWLEQYLQGYAGTVIVVSHDRYFLNKMVTKIVELANQKLYVWEGNYDFYLLAKEERDSLQRRQYENQQQYIKDQEKFINRFRAKASKATAVQSRVKMLDKLDKIEEVSGDGPVMRLKFDVAYPSGKVVMELKDIGKSFGSKLILEKAEGIIRRGDKIALIGANGKGKSTLLRIIHGSEPFSGERKEGHNVNTGFFAQHQLESLNLANTILDELKQHGSKLLDSEIRNLLGCFLFGGDEVMKKIKVLSGGEKSRVALAKTLIEQSNFLMLDEPTNHLDIQSIEVLIQALKAYTGTFVLVSHDRNFIAHTANKIWWIEGHQIKEYPGDYNEFAEWQQRRTAAVQNAVVKKAEAPKIVEQKLNGQSNEEKERKNKLNKLNKRVEELEEKLEKRQSALKEVEEKLNNPSIAGNHQEITELSIGHAQATDALKVVQKALDEAVEALILAEED